MQSLHETDEARRSPSARLERAQDEHGQILQLSHGLGNSLTPYHLQYLVS